MKDITTKLFNIQKELETYLPEGHRVVDQGMFCPVEPPEHFRDMVVEVASDEREYAFSYSNKGSLTGDIPPLMKNKVVQLMMKLALGESI